MPSLLCLALSNAVAATLLAVLAAVVARFCRRPAVRHALWLLVLLKLITPPLLPLSVSWPRSDEDQPVPVAEHLLVPQSSEEIISAEPQQMQEAIAARSVSEETPLAYAAGSDGPVLVGKGLIALWLGGALAWWTVAVVRLGRFRRLLRQAQPAATEVEEQGQRMAALLRLRRCPPIRFVSAPLSPMLWALGFSPRLLLPAELWRRLTAEQQDSLLAHELAHLRRRDHWVRRLEMLVLGLYWWHPVVWWARRRLQEAEEECCDALVIAVLPDAAPSYASALVETVTFLSQTRPAALVGASGAGQVPLLKRRLVMILSETSSRKRSRIGFWIVLGMGALLLPLAPRAAQTQAPEESERIESVAEEPPTPKAQAMTKVLQMANCASCHQLPVSPHDLQHPWKEIHHELLRLTDEYTRELHKSDRRPRLGEDGGRAEKLEELQDEIELLKVQVRLKEAHVEGTKKTLNEYQRRLRNYEGINRRQPGTIPQDTIMETQLAITTREAQLQVNEVELQQSSVRLKHAERRLARLQPRETPRIQMPEARYQPAAKSSWNTSWAEALFDRRSVDLPDIAKRGTGTEVIFYMTNNGKYPVHIANLRTSADYLKAFATKYKVAPGYELSPGESGEIHAQLDTSKPIGSETLKVYVQFDKPDRQEVVLEIRIKRPNAAPAKPQSPERLQQLEKKLDELRKEMENLRREMGPDKKIDPISKPNLPMR